MSLCVQWEWKWAVSQTSAYIEHFRNRNASINKKQFICFNSQFNTLTCRRSMHINWISHRMAKICRCRQFRLFDAMHFSKHRQQPEQPEQKVNINQNGSVALAVECCLWCVYYLWMHTVNWMQTDGILKSKNAKWNKFDVCMHSTLLVSYLPNWNGHIYRPFMTVLLYHLIRNQMNRS